MAKRLIIISDLSDERITDIIEILEANDIHFYVTPAGAWVRSLEAIWLKKDHDTDRARSLLNEYFQKVRADLGPAEYSNAIKHRNIVQKILNDPMLLIFIVMTLVIFTAMLLLLA